MSDARTSPVDVVRSVYAAFARGDLPGFFALLSPDIEWIEAAGHPYGGIYRGVDAITQNVLVPLGTQWDQFTAEPEEFLAQGDKAVSTGYYRGMYKATGKRVDAWYAVVWTVKDGKVVKLHQHTDTALFHAAMR